MELNESVAMRYFTQQSMQKNFEKVIEGGGGFVTSRFSCSIHDLLVLAASTGVQRLSDVRLLPFTLAVACQIVTSPHANYFH